jgi:hypothetical protein
LSAGGITANLSRPGLGPLLTLTRRNSTILLKSSTTGVAVATMNFSVPDDVKDAFNAAFEGQNKSAVIAGLMREAVARSQRRQEHVNAIERILARHGTTPVVTEEEFVDARELGRP